MQDKGFVRVTVPGGRSRVAIVAMVPVAMFAEKRPCRLKS